MDIVDAKKIAAKKINAKHERSRWWLSILMEHIDTLESSIISWKEEEELWQFEKSEMYHKFSVMEISLNKRLAELEAKIKQYEDHEGSTE